jgi:hypothetical protein
MGEVAPAAFLERVDRRIGAEGTVVDAVFGLRLALVERTPGDRGVESLVGKAVLHRHRHGTTERVQAEHGGRAQGVDPVDGDVRDEVPIDRIAEGFVDAHAVLVDRDPLRRAEHRGRFEAAKHHVGLEWIRSRVIEVDAAQLLVECAEHARRAVSDQVARSQRLDVPRDLVPVHLEARHGSAADDDDFVKGTGVLGRLLRGDNG